mmetsp:Transcript_1080/g.1992  ORF Transcript_1080/g.1992 Transcript_1080/m.1992 type:complete len:96 (+) Transcript_1080:589-876(+)
MQRSLHSSRHSTPRVQALETVTNEKPPQKLATSSQSQSNPNLGGSSFGAFKLGTDPSLNKLGENQAAPQPQQRGQFNSSFQMSGAAKPPASAPTP